MSRIVRPFPRRHRWIILLSALFFSGWVPMIHAAAPENPREVGRAPIPGWVEPIEAEIPTALVTNAARAGSNELLAERQVNVLEASRYEHFATQFLTEDAVESGSRISVSFDPAYETLAFNRLTVRRDGKSTDRLSRQEIKVLQRESRLDWQLYDGRLSATIILEDIRVGDVLEYAYTVSGRNPIFGGRYLDSYETRWDEPLNRHRLRILCPTDRPFGIKAHGETLQPTVTQNGNITSYIWDWHDLPAVTSDGDVPSWFDPWPWLQFSEFGSWEGVVRWATDIYGVPQTIPAELDDELRKIAQMKTEEERVLGAVYFVQDNIRYLGLEVGENTHRPYPVATIVARRFGDCKDKALLLCTMLRKLGFEAYPALVNTDLRQTVADWLPTPLAFNHLVVQLRLHGKDYWLDATNRDQGGNLAELCFPDYGRALVIAPGADALTTVRPGGFDSSYEEVLDSFDFQDYQGAATLHVRTTYHGSRADSMRSFFVGMSLDAVQKKYLNYYARWYPHITAVEPPRFRDDRAHNVLVVEELYRLAEFWKGGSRQNSKLSGVFSAQMNSGVLESPSNRVRTMPFALHYPRKISHVIQVNLPWNMEFEAEDNRIDDRAFKYRFSVVPSNLRLELRYSYEALSDHVTAADVPTYLANVERVHDLQAYEISIPERWTTSGAKSSPAATPPAKAATSVTQGNLHANEGTTATAASTASLAFQRRTLLVVCGAFAAVVAAAGLLWRRAAVRRRVVVNPSTLHRCVVCGKTEISEPSLDFRVAGDGKDYCIRHLPPRSTILGEERGPPAA